MNYPKYNITVSEQSDVYEFTSTGVKGEIEKIVHFQSTDNANLYNLAFGDKRNAHKYDDGRIAIEIDDTSKSENGDRDKILATVAATVYHYTSIYSDRWIIFSGSDEIKTRLYRMAITKNYDELSKDFHIFGLDIEDENIISVPFDSNRSFLGFIIKRKPIL